VTETGVSTAEEVHSHIRGRDFISDFALGLTDGLVTNLAFLAGFAGAVSEVSVLRLAGTAAMLAGTVSMFFGGLLKARSESDLYEADSRREAQEIDQEPDEEKRELKGFYVEKGLTEAEAAVVVERISQNKGQWLKDILMHELSLHESHVKNPYRVAAIIGLGFLIGSFVPLLPYLIFTSHSIAVFYSVLVSLIFASISGAWKGRLAGKTTKSALETLGVAACAATILYLIGSLFIFV
jgi:VIT1/CCC1 family predicted Fe2+/Mn2+ transporter